MTTYTPTPRQADALRFIAGYIEAHEATPSMQAIADGMGAKAKSQAHHTVRALVERGWLLFNRYQRNGMEPVHPVTIPRGPAGEPLYFVRIKHG